MADEEDLVSQIKVTGGPQATAEIQSFADKGSAAFDKLNKSAAGSAAGVAAAATSVETGAKKAATGLQGINTGFNSSVAIGHIKGIEQALSGITQKLPQLTQAVGRFTQRFALVGAAAVAGAIGLASAARNIAKQVDGESDSFQKLTADQIDSNNSQLSGTVAAINHASALRQLSSQLSAGKITYSQYTQAVKDTNAQYQEQVNVAAQVEAAQEAVKQENDRLQKSLADRTAMNALISTFGGPLTQSLISFGRQVEGVRKDFITAFSPALASGIDLISGVLTKNATSISNFFDVASAKFQAFITNNGPALQKMFETLGSAAAAIFLGFLEAAPGVIAFFNNQLAPAVQKVIGAFNLLADAINLVFGTKLTGGSLILIAILAQMTGSIRLLFTVIRSGGAIIKGIIGLAGQVLVAIAEAFGAKNAANVIKLATAVGKGGGPIKSFLAIVRTAIPVMVALGEAVATALGIGFGPAIIVIGLLAAALFFLIKNVDWTKFVANAKATGAALVKFFSELPGKIGAFFVTLWDGVKNLASAAVDFVVSKWNRIINFFQALPAQIVVFFTQLWDSAGQLASDAAQFVIDKWNAVVTFFTELPATLSGLFTTVWQGIQDLAAAAVQFVIDKWNTVVTFFQSLPGTLQSVWDTISTAISNAFQTAVNAVTGFFSDLAARVTKILQPIINLLKTIIALGASASQSADGAGAAGGGAFAGGGRIRGPGGPRDDRVPIWASNGEFMMQARAVAKYGAAFMHAVNSGQFELGRFAMGGMIAPAPARTHFADGGRVTGGGRPISLTIGNETFAGLIAPDDVADRLVKFATIRQVRSAGRKPSWVGSRK